MVEKLAKHNIKMVRLGHPARLLPGIRQFSLDAVVSCYDGNNVVDELHKEIGKITVSMVSIIYFENVDVQEKLFTFLFVKLS